MASHKQSPQNTRQYNIKESPTVNDEILKQYQSQKSVLCNKSNLTNRDHYYQPQLSDPLLNTAYHILTNTTKYWNNLHEITHEGMQQKWKLGHKAMRDLIGLNQSIGSGSNGTRYDKFYTPCTVTLMPNFSCHSPLSPPVGYLMEIPNKHINTNVPNWIINNKYGYGTLALRIPNNLILQQADYIQQEKIFNISYFQQQQQQQQTPESPSQNRQFLKISSTNRTTIQDDKRSHIQKGNLLFDSNSNLSHEGSFSGIYKTTNRFRNYTDEIWIVVQTNNPECATPFLYGETWKSLLNNHELNDILDKHEQHRHKVARYMLKKFFNISDDRHCYKVIANTNMLEELYNGDMSYYSHCSPIGTVNIMHESPITGSYILWGENIKEKSYDNNDSIIMKSMKYDIKESQRVKLALPYCTGREKSFPGWIKSQGDKYNIHSHIFTSHGHRLDPSAYRYRDQPFMSCEKLLGRKPNVFADDCLEPVIVFMK